VQPSRPVTRDDSESSLGALSEGIKSSTWSRACIPSDDTVATARPDRSSKPRAARSALGLQTLRRQSHGAPEPAGRFLAALDGLNRLFGLQKKVTELGTPQRTGRARGSAQEYILPWGHPEQWFGFCHNKLQLPP